MERKKTVMDHTHPEQHFILYNNASGTSQVVIAAHDVLYPASNREWSHSFPPYLLCCSQAHCWDPRARWALTIHQPLQNLHLAAFCTIQHTVNPDVAAKTLSQHQLLCKPSNWPSAAQQSHSCFHLENHCDCSHWGRSESFGAGPAAHVWECLLFNANMCTCSLPGGYYVSSV